MLQEAMPRKAVEALESEVRNLAERIDHGRHAGADEPALAGVERGLAEVRERCADDARPKISSASIRRCSSSRRRSTYCRQRAGPGRASPARRLDHGDARHRLARGLERRAGEAVRRGARARRQGRSQPAGSGSGSVSPHSRIGSPRSPTRSSPQSAWPELPARARRVVKGLTDKIERIQLTRGDHTALGHLEDRIAKLVEKLDASDARLNHLEAIERGLAELLIQLEHQRMPNSPAPASPAPPEIEALSRDLADLRQTEKKTQDTLEVVHGTLGHVVDRLAMIETDMRCKPCDQPAPRPTSHRQRLPRRRLLRAGLAVSSRQVLLFAKPQPDKSRRQPVWSPTRQPTRLDLPSLPIGAAAETASAPAPMPPRAPCRRACLARLRSRSNSLRPATARAADAAAHPAAAERRPIDPNLPPDHPLEPGFSVTRGRTPGSPADRIAASEAALAGAKPPVIPDPGGKSNFIAAARRAAQAAGRRRPARRSGRRSTSSDIASAAGKLASRVGKLRALIGGGAVGDLPS